MQFVTLAQSALEMCQAIAAGAIEAHLKQGASSESQPTLLYACEVWHSVCWSSSDH